MCMKYCRFSIIPFGLILVSIILIPGSVLRAQGNIFGTVTNSDATTPADGEMSFFGYIDDTDEEIRIDLCIGAGYDNGNWYDDFQNFLTEAVDDPFDYHFYNTINNERQLITGVIANGSYQQANVVLTTLDWPEKPTGLTALPVSGPAIELSWDDVSGLTYHVYRREATSNGSFFRIDDPSGSLTDPGISGGGFIDNNVDGTSSYSYLVIAEDMSGNFSPHSDFITVSSLPFLCGDADNSGSINILDIVYIIEYKYKDGPPPLYLQSAEVNGDGSINILDIVYLIEYKYKEGLAPVCTY